MEHINLKQYEGLDGTGVLTKLLPTLGEINENIIAAYADSASQGLVSFRDKFPHRAYNFGIAEANMITAASGFAAYGKIAIAEIMGCLIPRAFEQIRDDICYNNRNVKILSNTCGVNYAAGGVTHHADTDISILRSIPNLTIIQPASPKELLYLTYKSILDFKGPVYLRISRSLKEEIYSGDKSELEFEIGKGITLHEGKDVAIIASGVPILLALKAEEILSKQGIEVRIINIHTIKPIDCEIILEAAKETKGIVTVEDASIAGGLGASVALIVSEQHPALVRQIGFSMDEFTVIGPSEEELWDYLGLSIDRIVEAVKHILSLEK